MSKVQENGLARPRRPGSIVKRGANTHLVRIFTGYDSAGTRKYRSETVHGTKKDAEDRLAVLRSQISNRQFDPNAVRKVTMDDLFELVLDDYKNNGQDWKWVEGVIRVRLRPSFGCLLASDVSSRTLRDHVAQLRDQKYPNASINRGLSVLRRAFNLGKNHTPKLVYDPPKITLLRENNVRKGFFEDSEYRQLVRLVPPEIAPIVTFAYYTGCRKSEILALRWEQVDLIANTVRLEAGETKNKEARIIPLWGELRALIHTCWADHSACFEKCPWVFHREGQRILDFRGAWNKACEGAGLWDGKKPTRLFHDLRRTGVRNLVRSGVSEKVAMAISGHKTRSVFDRYNIVSENDLVDAMGKVDAYIQIRRQEEQETADKAAEVSHTARTQEPNSRAS